MCVTRRLSVQFLAEIILILRRTDRDVIKIVCLLSCKVPVILVLFERNLNLLARFSKNTQMSNLMKIRPVEAELFHAHRLTYRRTDMTNLIVTFLSFSKGTKIYFAGLSA
jgi:hypothetical protein